MVAKVIEDGKSWMVKRETQKEIIPATAATCVLYTGVPRLVY